MPNAHHTLVRVATILACFLLLPLALWFNGGKISTWLVMTTAGPVAGLFLYNDFLDVRHRTMTYLRVTFLLSEACAIFASLFFSTIQFGLYTASSRMAGTLQETAWLTLGLTFTALLLQTVLWSTLLTRHHQQRQPAAASAPG